MAIFKYKHMADQATKRNLSDASNYKDAMLQEGGQNKKVNSAMAIAALANAKNSMQNSEGAINMANESFDKQMAQQNADLAAMGYSPSTNNVYMDANSTLAADRANTIANIENDIAKENFDTMSQGISSATNFYNQGFKNLTGSYSSALNALFNANQAQINNANNNVDRFHDLMKAAISAGGQMMAPIPKT